MCKQRSFTAFRRFCHFSGKALNNTSERSEESQFYLFSLLPLWGELKMGLYFTNTFLPSWMKIPFVGLTTLRPLRS